MASRSEEAERKAEQPTREDLKALAELARSLGIASANFPTGERAHVEDREAR